MKIDDFIRKFPDESFALYHLMRGPDGARKLTWMATWRAGYYTSDSNRHVAFEAREEVFGETPEEALENLLKRDYQSALAIVDGRREMLAEAEAELQALRAQLEK